LSLALIKLLLLLLLLLLFICQIVLYTMDIFV